MKEIDSSLLQGDKTENFSALIENIAKIHHKNIAELVGYCSEKGHNILIYEYFGNGSLHEFLHVRRLQQTANLEHKNQNSLGTARAIE